MHEGGWGVSEVEEASKRFRFCVPLLVAQALGAFNDNATKAMLPALAALVISKAEMDPVNQLVSLMLILPFVLFGPLAGWLSDRFSKRKVVSVALFAQVVGLAVLCAGMGMQWFTLSLVGFFLLAIQSAMLSPAKKGILKELVGTEKLGMAVGWMEMLTMVGILAGAYAGAKGFDTLVETEGGWRAGFWVSGAVGVLAIISWLVFRPTPEVAPRSQKPFRFGVLFSHFHDLAALWKDKPLRLAACGDAWFWAFGTFFYLVLVKLSGEVIEGDVGMASLYGLWFLMLGVGIMAGSLVAAYVNRGRVELGLVPIGAVLMPIVLYGLTQLAESDPEGLGFKLCCVGLGAGGAFFFVPLNAFLQDRAGEERRGRVVAASNLLTNLFVIALIGLHAYLSNKLGLTAKDELLVMVIPCFLLAVYVVALLPQALFRAVTIIVTRLVYRVQVNGASHVPREGGLLVLCNHVSYADPVLLGANFPRESQFLAFSGLGENRVMRLIFRLTSTIPVSPVKAKDAIVRASERLRAGEVVCLFPEGGISRLGPMIGFKKGFELIARRGAAPVMPAYLDGAWGSIFSFADGRFFRKWPRSLPYPVRLRLGEPIPPKEATVERVRSETLRLAREAFSERDEWRRSLPEEIRDHLRRDGDKPLLLLPGEPDLTREEFLRLAEQTDPEERPALEEEASSASRVRDASLRLAALALRGEELQAGGAPWSSPELLASVGRLRETILWNKDAFHVRLEDPDSLDSPWDQTWLLWAPLLGDLSAQWEEGGRLILCAHGGPRTPTAEAVTGLALAGLGVVSLNLPDPPADNNPDDQKGSAEGSLGRLLPGLDARLPEGELELAGVSGEWTKAGFRAKFDEEGFLHKEE